MGPHTGGLILLLVCSVQATNFSPTVESRVHNLCEDLKKGDHAFDIEASDAEGDPLTYRLSGLQASVFAADRATGRVTLTGGLDREREDVLTFQAHANDGTSEGQGTINIIVLDVNDNLPIFEQVSYDTSVPENAPIGQSLLKVSATDLDTGSAGAVTYKIDEVSPAHGAGLFEIDLYIGEVRLKGRMNYTSMSPFYRLKINASDGGGSCGSGPFIVQSNSMFSLITVEDVADLDPLFINIPPVLRVEENSPVDFSVFTVVAIDQDTGINDVIIYSIEDSKPPGLFKISPNDGVISVLSAIDREETGNTVTLTLKATEANLDINGRHASTTKTMQITIVDVNDNPPEFYECDDSCVKKNEFTGKVLEHFTGFISLSMTVKDPDEFVNTKLTLEGVDKEVFSVEPSTTTTDSIVQLRVRQPENLDFEEKQQMVLQIIAEDVDEPRFRTTATVTIIIEDDNDNSPTFPQVTYELEVPEHSTDNTTLATITAEDPDTMDQGKLTYELLPDSILSFFDVDPAFGRVYVKNGALLDRETRSLYTATLQVRDTGNKPGSTLLEITLTDINDQPPIFNRPSYQENVNEGAKFEYKVEATDRDEPNTVNSQILYSIEPNKFSNNFTMDENTGWLRNKGELDLEALDPELNGRITLNIMATDKGIPPLSSTVPFIIDVLDINDNSPKFDEAFYKFSVKEGEKGAFVGSVHALDLDQTTTFNRISFRITSGGYGSFGIVANAVDRGYIGKISVDQDVELDYEAAQNTFKLGVLALDPDQKNDSATVTVIVLDVNDERPEFLPMDPVSVKENTTIIEPIGKFKAQDKDTNHSLIYMQESVTCRCKDTMRSCDWFIVDPNGDVRVNPKETVDYEECDQVIVEAQVVDEYTEKGENNSVKPGQMVVNIEDINDNIPEFSHSESVNVVVAEGSSKGTSVASVTASDKDSGKNREIVFTVQKTHFEHINNLTEEFKFLFDIVTTQQGANYVGLIKSSKGLDTTLRGKYLVTVTATDTGGLEASTVVEIFTVDESFKVELEFVRSQAEVEENKEKIRSELTFATGAAVEIVKIRGVTRETARSLNEVVQSVMVAYFVYRNGSALTNNEVEVMISKPEHFNTLQNLGLKYISKVETDTQKTSPLQFALLGVVAGLIIVLVVLTTSLICTRRNYKRKLKAAKAMNTASIMNSDNQKGVAVVPGTNKYTKEGANPVLNLQIDTTLALDLDGESSSDMDKASFNSLDDNFDITNDAHHDMHRIEEEEEDDGPPEYYNEPLGAALAQLGPKKTPKTFSVGLTNPTFDTTDL